MTITKTVRVGTKARVGSVFVTIKFEEGRLSITGVEGPKANGDCRGGCGQIDLNEGEWLDFADGWNAETVTKLADIWADWHLNDVRAGNPQQMAWLKANPVTYVYPQSHYDAATKALDAAGLNPQGDRYGHKWHRADVPAEVIAWLDALPVADVPSAWKD